MRKHGAIDSGPCSLFQLPRHRRIRLFEARLDPDSIEDAIMLGQATLEVAADGVVQVRDGASGIPAG